MGKKVGPRPQYSDEELIEMIEKFVSKNTNVEVTPTRMHRATGVSYNIWKQNKKIRKLMDEINNPPIPDISFANGVEFPNAKDIVDRFYKNRDELIRQLDRAFHVLHDIYDYAVIGYNSDAIQNKHVEEISRLKAEIIRLENKNKDLHDEIDLLYLDSESPLERRDKNLRNNKLEISKKSVAKNPDNIREMFPGIFKKTN